MSRAFELATNGCGNVSPNPMVGCVIVHNDKIIGEGWHKEYGGPHAEVNAINAVKDQELLKQATVYVTLEPCSHQGMTPPCADLLVSSKVKKVVIANKDPNPLVSGNGVKRLEENGIEVSIGLLSDKGEKVNRRFFSYHRCKRPYIILKWAETSDGFIAKKNNDSKWISNPYSRQIVHRWRAEEDAILVGKNTAHYDNPSLTVRDATGKNPTRIVIDHNLSLSGDLHLFDQKEPTLCYNLRKNEKLDNLEFVQLGVGNFEQALLQDLYNRKILSCIIEGGANTISRFVDNQLWDEARVFKSSTVFSEGIAAPSLSNSRLVREENIMGDQLFIYEKTNG